MGTIKTTNIETITGSGTLTLGQSGETVSVPSGATLDLSNATQTGVGGTNTPAFHAFLSADQGSIAGNAETKVQINTEVLDTDGNYDNSTNYRFTPTTAGTYFVYANLIGEFDTKKLGIIKSIIKKNGTTVSTTDSFFQDDSLQRLFSYTSTLIEMNGSSDYLEFYGYIDRYAGGSTTGTFHGSSSRETYFGAYKIIT